ncbi:type I restriction-modification system subunit M [Thermoanaerobacter siderophilus]|uniref:site-specific DNA-methyltransferase (adenine-specific) n=1 Tax=Thermoanaerobacter siderophilus SR4 TaxID=880478 RepID=I8R3F8_9THEO|nr:class I SAM-dependent DNA methyltransferase [Thermoanaerobacter siderophilus]EIV99909.1 type I restriction-modification system methyltransferase subunit [Thermoanaerobacter siderophilus SR4]
MEKNMLDLSTLENWLWEAACKIRGPVDAPKFKDYILPLIFLKRLSDVFEDEINHLAEEFGDIEIAWKLVEEAHRRGQPLVRFYLPPEARWEEIRKKTTGIGQYLTDVVRAVARENPKLQGVIDVVDFNATAAGQRIIDDGPLADLIQVLSKYRLGINDVEPDILGRAYEYLLRKFAEGQGQSAGEFYTPKEVAILMARILEPQPGMTVYDPCCGSGGLLIKCHLRLLEVYGERQNGRLKLPTHFAPLRLYGQEINPTTFAMAKMNAFIHEMDSEIALGDTMRRPAFTKSDSSLMQFDLVTANPMWNQKFSTEVYEHDPYNRFNFGIPPSSSADWGWIQHMYASLNEKGKMAVVLDTGAVSRGSGNQGSNRERDIRKVFVEKDRIESVILLPENLFYNTSAPGIILVINKNKRHPGEILLINASKLYSKGRPKNYLTDEHIEKIVTIYHNWTAEEGLSAIITNEEAARNDYNLSPSRYVSQNGTEEVLPLEETIVQLQEAEEECSNADRELEEVLKALGLGGLISGESEAYK